MTAHNQKLVNKIAKGLRSRYPLFYILGWEEERMERLLAAISSSLGEGQPLNAAFMALNSVQSQRLSRT
jgi:hypothetical protein